MMGLSENTRGNQSSGGGVVALIMACLAVVIILLVMQNHRAQNTPTPVPSPSVSLSATSEDDASWSCRTSGNGLCGDTDVWVWGIRSFA